jgi:AIG2-like family.
MNDLSSTQPVLYFAYGANMHPGQIIARCHGAEVVAVAKLADHALAFFGRSERWDGGEEAAIRRPGAELYGVVYRLSPAAFDRLDAWQGAKLDGSGAYFHCPADVVAEDGTAYSAVMYKRSTTGEPQPPSTEYLSYIAAGAEKHGLPAAYVQALKAMGSVKASYAVPKEGPTDRFLMSLPLGAPCAC